MFYKSKIKLLKIATNNRNKPLKAKQTPSGSTGEHVALKEYCWPSSSTVNRKLVSYYSPMRGINPKLKHGQRKAECYRIMAKSRLQ